MKKISRNSTKKEIEKAYVLESGHLVIGDTVYYDDEILSHHSEILAICATNYLYLRHGSIYTRSGSYFGG